MLLAASRSDVPPSPPRRLDLGAVLHSAPADAAEVRRWASSFRRVDHLELCDLGGRWCVRVHGVGHRVPVVRHVPPAVAVGLARRGVPVRIVRGGQP